MQTYPCLDTDNITKPENIRQHIPPGRCEHCTGETWHRAPGHELFWESGELHRPIGGHLPPNWDPPRPIGWSGQQQGWVNRCREDAADERDGVKQPGKLRVERGRQQRRPSWAPGKRGIFSIFLKWDSDTEAWKLQWPKTELLIYLSWHYIKLQSSESKHQVKETKDHISSSIKAFPLPFLFCSSKLTPRNWALILGSMR